MYYKKLIGKNIYLAPKTIEDAEKYAEWLNDFRTTDYLGKSGKIMTLEKEREYLETHIDDEATLNIITLSEDKLIGTVGIENIDHLNKRGTLGIFIGRSEYRSKGYGAEAINLILDFGFNYMNLNSINLTVLDCNERAKACYKKCGFKEMGRERQGKFVNGKYYDAIMMDILREEFKGREYIKNKNVK